MQRYWQTATILGLFAASPTLADRAHDLAAQASSQTTASCGNVTTLAGCHPGKPTGCSHSQNPRYDPYLNFLKNQAPARDLVPDRALSRENFVELEDAIPGDLSTRNHADFADALAGLGEGNIVSLVGFLYFVENTAVTSKHRGETCNCQLKTNPTFDFHLGLGFDADLARQVRQHLVTHDPNNTGELEQTSIVAEMTPHTRDTKWTVSRLNQRALGRSVKVIGQLVADNAHVSEKDDCDFEDDPARPCWRATVWEIHPVIQFLVCRNGATCTDSSPNTDWITLEELP